MAIDVIEKDKKEIRWLGLSNETTNELNGVEVNISIYRCLLPLCRASFMLLRKG